jgi:hypothetical protein
MYYTWTGWWWFAWLIPTFLILWAMIGGLGRRYDGYWSRERYLRDQEWDDRWVRRGSGRKHRNRGPRNYRRSDERIKEDVSDRLMLEDELDPSAMEVQVENGRVILMGTVATRFEKRLAESLADSVAGVTDVDNRLKIGSLEGSTGEAASHEHAVATHG